MGLLFTLGRVGARHVDLISISVSCTCGRGHDNWPRAERTEEQGGGVARNFREDTDLICVMKRSMAQLRAGNRVMEGERVGHCRLKRKGTNNVLGEGGGYEFPRLEKE